jgi:hypothetical protein
VTSAEARNHDGVSLNGRADDLSKEMRDMELKLQFRMDKMVTDCNDISTRLEQEFMDVAIHLDTTLAGKTMELATKMEEFMSAIDTKLSRELMKHEEIMTFRHEQVSQEGLDLKECVAEMKHTHNSNIQHLSAIIMQLGTSTLHLTGTCILHTKTKFYKLIWNLET